MLRFLFSFLWILILFPDKSMTQGNSSGMIVMTFNIRYDNPRDGQFRWEKRKHTVKQVLHKEDPDIIGFQEVLDNQYWDLVQILSDYHSFGRGRDDGLTAGEYAPVFYRQDRFSILDSGVFWLSKQPNIPGSRSWGAACTRIVTWVKLIDNPNQDTLYVFNTHFDHMSQEARIQSAILLDSAISHTTQSLPSIIMGDFNTTFTDSAYQVLARNFMLAAPLAMQGRISTPGHPERTGEIGNIPIDQLKTTFIGCPADLTRNTIIDFIFYTPHNSFHPHHPTIIDYNNQEFYPSDHLPVVVDLTIKKPQND